MLIFIIRKVYKMKYFQKVTLSLLVIVAMTLGNKAVAAITVEGEDSTQHLATGGAVTVNDTNIANSGAVVFTAAGSTADLVITAGIVRVGAASKVLPADVGTLAGLLPSGATTVQSGAILEITAATAGCVAGALEVESGGILQVDVDVPSGSSAFGSTLKMDSGSVLKLGAGKTWGKNISVGNAV